MVWSNTTAVSIMNKKKVNEETFHGYWRRRVPQEKNWFIRFKYKQYTRSSLDMLKYIDKECI